MLSYGAKLVNEGSITGPHLLAFIVYQLTLGSLLSVSVFALRDNEGIPGLIFLGFILL